MKMTPQQNGLAERTNMILLERVRYMLITIGMSNKLWEVTVKIAAYIINRSPSKSLEFKCP